MELIATVRRIDTDGDANILYSEWAEFLRPAFPSPRPPTSSSPIRSSSPARTSPLKSSSPMRASSPMRTSSPVRASVSPSRASPSRKPILRIYDEDELVHGLKDLCNQEQELENAKISLA